VSVEEAYQRGRIDGASEQKVVMDRTLIVRAQHAEAVPAPAQTEQKRPSVLVPEQPKN